MRFLRSLPKCVMLGLNALNGSHALSALDIQGQQHKADEQRENYYGPTIIAYPAVDPVQEIHKQTSHSESSVECISPRIFVP